MTPEFEGIFGEFNRCTAYCGLMTTLIQLCSVLSDGQVFSSISDDINITASPLYI